MAEPTAAEVEAAAQAEKNRMDRIIEYANALPPDQRGEFLKRMSTDFGLAGSDAVADMSRADALRVATPEGRTAGRTYVAANPLEHLAAALRNKKASTAYDEALGRRDTAREGEASQRRSVMAELLRQKIGGMGGVQKPTVLTRNPHDGGY